MDYLVSGDGFLVWPGGRMRCTLGRSGIRSDKREGDGATPTGRLPLRVLYYRPDREPLPETALSVLPITPSTGWCDAPVHPDYNRPVELPHPASCEMLWRQDSLYDLTVVLGYNDDPVVPDRGSAIFLHLASPDGKPTEGCVALARDDLLSLIKTVRPGDALVISAP